MTSDRDRLIELFKKTEYTPFPEMTMTSNLGNQFTDYGLNCIVDNLLANGVIVSPCKVGDKVYMRFEGEITPLTIIRISTLETIDGISRCYDAKNKIVSTSFTDRHINKTMCLTKEEAEAELRKRSEYNA